MSCDCIMSSTSVCCYQRVKYVTPLQESMTRCWPTVKDDGPMLARRSGLGLVFVWILLWHYDLTQCLFPHSPGHALTCWPVSLTSVTHLIQPVSPTYSHRLYHLHLFVILLFNLKFDMLFMMYVPHPTFFFTLWIILFKQTVHICFVLLI